MTAPSPIVPPDRPHLTASDPRLAHLTAHCDPTLEAVRIVGIRGYYQHTMGDPAVNDYGIYDDALIVLSPTAFVTFNANTDPSVLYTHVAMLQPGTWHYQLGIHGLSKPRAEQYEALVQAAPVTVDRYRGPTETGMFGINIHRGSRLRTDSAGCQTIFLPQWGMFIALVKNELKRYHQTIVPYVLVTNETFLGA